MTLTTAMRSPSVPNTIVSFEGSETLNLIRGTTGDGTIVVELMLGAR